MSQPSQPSPLAIHEFRVRVERGLINAIPDPTGSGLTIYDYSPRCQFDAAWDEYTLAARGLVLDGDGRVVARPFRKFFNLGEPGGETRAGHPELFEKYDGSLIIVFHDGDRWRCTTRGSWTSEQALAAAAWLQPALDSGALAAGSTWLFEYVAPGNRVIVPYDEERCVLLGVVDNVTGTDWARDRVRDAGSAVGVEVARSHGVRELAQLDLAGGDGMREGYVAVWPCGHRVKLKFAEYLRLHKLRTGLSVRGIWQELAQGRDVIDGRGLPDEFMGWYRRRRDELLAAYAAAEQQLLAVFAATRALLGDADRKTYALHWTATDGMEWMPGALFRLLDGRDHADIVWRAIEPVANRAASTCPL